MGSQMPLSADGVAERFSSNIKYSSDECWLWTGTLDRNGYGRFGIDGRQPAAHRVSWRLHRGEIPVGLYVCHHCDVPGCVNPEHLFLGTQTDNMRDRTRKGRTARGERQGHSKLRTDDVLEIRRLTGSSQREIARRFGISQSMVSDIVSRRKWCHV